MTGSSFALSCPIVHEGVMRRSDDEFSEVIWRGRSPAVWRDIFELLCVVVGWNASGSMLGSCRAVPSGMERSSCLAGRCE